MLRKITLTLSSACFALVAQAQITLTNPGQTAPLTRTDAFLSAAVTAMPTAGANMQWDYGNGVPVSTASLQLGPVNHPSFASSTFVIEDQFSEIISGYGFWYNEYRELTGNHFAKSGIHIPAQNYSTTFATGGASDSLYIANQVIQYSARPATLRFPATYQNSWVTTYNSNMNVVLDAPGMFLNMAPMQRRRRITESSEVVGWGNMRVPTANGPSVWYPVLMLKNIVTMQDSFYLNGSPAPASLLTFLTLEQGGMSHEYRNSYYRQGTVMPLMTFRYSDPAFTDMYQAAYDNSASITTAAPADQEAAAAVLYPNPATGHSAMLRFSKADGSTWQLRLTDALGRTCTTQPVAAAAGVTEQRVELPQSLANGLYTWQLTDAAGNLRSTGKLSIAR